LQIREWANHLVTLSFNVQKADLEFLEPRGAEVINKTKFQKEAIWNNYKKFQRFLHQLPNPENIVDELTSQEWK
jgi:hypothetical protein